LRNKVGDLDQHSRIVLWGGGLWPWLDPLTAIRAMKEVVLLEPDARLIFPGTRHPNPTMEQIPTHVEAARQLVNELGLTAQVIFLEGWMPYSNWQEVLLESDVALALHHSDALETRLSFRTRVLDYIWAGIPIVITHGDSFSELISKQQLGVVVEQGDAHAVAEAIIQLLMQPCTNFEGAFHKTRDMFVWEKVAEPLIQYCREPYFAADHLSEQRQCIRKPSLANVINLRSGTTDIETDKTPLNITLGEKTKSIFTGIRSEILRIIGSYSLDYSEFESVNAAVTSIQIDTNELSELINVPAWLLTPEKLFLYTLILSLRPQKVLEFGTYKGGSTRIISMAMDHSNSQGKIYCIDPNFCIEPHIWTRIQHRTTLIQGFSPEAISQASQIAQAKFDFVFIDGDHTFDGVWKDANGVLTYVEKYTFLLFHDHYYPEVFRAIRQFVSSYPHKLIDCGPITTEYSSQNEPDGREIHWGGLRLLRVVR
jgi:predicted O-methyltransferase YrrM